MDVWTSSGLVHEIGKQVPQDGSPTPRFTHETSVDPGDQIDDGLIRIRVSAAKRGTRVHGTLPSTALYTAWSELEVSLICRAANVPSFRQELD